MKATLWSFGVIVFRLSVVLIALWTLMVFGMTVDWRKGHHHGHQHEHRVDGSSDLTHF